MTIALVTNVTNTGGTGTTAAANTTGANFLALGATGPGSAYTQGADNKSNTWIDGTYQVNNVGAVYARIGYVISSPVVGSSHTFTTSTTVFYDAVMAAAFSGVGAYDQESGASDTGLGTSHPASSGGGGTITPANAGSLLISHISFSADPGTVTVPTGFTLLNKSITSTYLDGAMAYEIQSGTTARTPVWGTSNSVRSCAVTSVFRPSAGSGTAVAPGVGSLAITGPVPTVTRTTNQSVVPGVGALTITGPVPTVTRSGSSALLPGAGALTITGPVPTVTRTAGQAVAPGAGALTITGPVPTVVRSSSSGTLTTGNLKNNATTVAATRTGLVVVVLSGTTGLPIVSKTSQATNGSGVLIVTDALIVPGSTYHMAVIDPAASPHDVGITNLLTAT